MTSLLAYYKKYVGFYSAYRLRFNKALFMWSIGTFKDFLIDVKSDTTIYSSLLIFTFTENFPIRFCMTSRPRCIKNTTGQT